MSAVTSSRFLVVQGLEVPTRKIPNLRPTIDLHRVPVVTIKAAETTDDLTSMSMLVEIIKKDSSVTSKKVLTSFNVDDSDVSEVTIVVNPTVNPLLRIRAVSRLTVLGTEGGGHVTIAPDGQATFDSMANIILQLGSRASVSSGSAHGALTLQSIDGSGKTNIQTVHLHRLSAYLGVGSDLEIEEGVIGRAVLDSGASERIAAPEVKVGQVTHIPRYPSKADEVQNALI